MQIFNKVENKLVKIVNHLFEYHATSCTKYTWRCYMSNTKQWKPGETVPKSASYTAYDSEGHNGGSLYLEKGKRFPATQHSGSYYTLGE